ncbi:MAG TPA: polyprenyl synthetase family protein [Kofleriaceae bacterium]|jgi:geranylgeranyl pyrophosphate synthase|nr:polyprenyl synthetase family protein [Kofleriaceae bacterium]
MTTTPTLATVTAPAALHEFFDTARREVDAELERRLAVPAIDPGRLAEAMAYAALGPGKRLRPALVLAAAEACRCDLATAMPAAVAIEMLHAYTLVHDDLPAMDDDDFRRGRPTVHVEFGEAVAILAGDGLLTQAFATLAELGPRAADAVAVLAARAGARELLIGQAIDLTGEAPRTIADVERLHAAKTGALFAAAAELGGIVAGADAATREDLARYGLAIGIAFQHADDRDDAELGELADAAAERMRELSHEARQIAQRMGAGTLEAIALWIGSRA